MNVKKCEFCGKVFRCRSNKRKYCCDSCRREASRIRRIENEHLCWHCQNVCCGCSWSRCFKPVNGWIAEQTIIKDSTKDFSSYKVHKCPEFIKD